MISLLHIFCHRVRSSFYIKIFVQFVAASVAHLLLFAASFFLLLGRAAKTKQASGISDDFLTLQIPNLIFLFNKEGKDGIIQKK